MSESKELFGLRGSNFSIRLEYTEGMVIVHLPSVDKMTPSTFKEMKEMLHNWLEFFQTQGLEGVWAAVPTNNTPVLKLAYRLGFKHIGFNKGLNVLFIGEL